MPRPNIVRADTLDLQDQDNPSAQDHTKSPPQQNLEFGDQLIGAHQAQEIRQISRERQEEEHNLQQAWNAAGDGTRSDSSSIGGSTLADHGMNSDADADLASDDDMMDRISSSPSIDDEDIDFDFVYALHTFVATVEGQANATKGDTMVLLDDSNSYWWLVRIVKDSSIGYLPAEHIETPTERLARLNKHRNVDLSAAMLGDNAERKRNPLKKAMKRRGAKSVTFVDAANNYYVEPSDYEYSSDEEDGMSEVKIGLAPSADNGSTSVQQNGQQQHQQQYDPQQEQQKQVQSQSQSQSQQQTTSSTSSSDPSGASTEPRTMSLDSRSTVDSPPTSPKLQEMAEGAPLKSRHGTPRNAESFMKDDTVETRKFTLTPNLLRDDSSAGGPRLREVTPGRGEGNDPFISDKEIAKEDKRKKDKKQRTFSGLFKSRRKEKEKGRKDHLSDTEGERGGSSDTVRSGNTTLAGDSSPNLRDVERKSSQKGRRLHKSSAASSVSTTPQTMSPQLSRSSSFPVELEGSQVAYEAPTGLEEEIHIAPPVVSNPVGVQPKINGEVKRTSPPPRIASRSGLDSLDEEHDEGSVYEDDGKNESFMHGTEAVHIPLQTEGYASSDDDLARQGQATAAAELREGSSSPASSIVEITDLQPSEWNSKAVTNGQGQDKADEDPTPVPSKPQSPEHAMAAAGRGPSVSGDSSPLDPVRQNSKSSTSSTSRGALSPSPASTSATTWSDAGLLAWAEGDNDIRDMLTIIYDPSEVKADREHPWVKDLFKEEKETLDSLSRELDGLLHGYLARRSGRGVEVPASVG